MIYLSDWGVSPNDKYVNLYPSDEDDEDEWHCRGGLRFEEGDYVAIYEYPRKETDMPIFLRV